MIPQSPASAFPDWPPQSYHPFPLSDLPCATLVFRILFSDTFHPNTSPMDPLHPQTEPACGGLLIILGEEMNHVFLTRLQVLGSGAHMPSFCPTIAPSTGLGFLGGSSPTPWALLTVLSCLQLCIIKTSAGQTSAFDPHPSCWNFCHDC